MASEIRRFKAAHRLHRLLPVGALASVVGAVGEPRDVADIGEDPGRDHGPDTGDVHQP